MQIDLPPFLIGKIPSRIAYDVKLDDLFVELWFEKEPSILLKGPLHKLTRVQTALGYDTHFDLTEFELIRKVGTVPIYHPTKDFFPEEDHQFSAETGIE